MADPNHKRDVDRGRDASTPLQIPRWGWRDILLRLRQEFRDDNVMIVAAGLAFYGFLSLFPALAALVSVYGLVFDVNDVYVQVSRLRGIIPPSGIDLIQNQLLEISKVAEERLGVGAVVGLVFAAFSARQGTVALLKALNIAYNEEEGRGFLKQTLIAFVSVIVAVFGGSFALMVIVVFPPVVEMLDVHGAALWIAYVVRWCIMFVVTFVAMAAAFRYAPNRTHARWPWLTPGALLGTVMLLLGSAGFSFYASSSSAYDETYGSIAAVVIVQMWLYLSALSVLIGGKFNAVMEHQTAQDTTIGPEKKMGERGAHVADTLGQPM